MRGLTVSCVLFLVACTDAPSLAPRSSLRPSLSQNVSVAAGQELVAAAQGRVSRGIEDEILRLENTVPGVGGLFADSTGQLVLYLHDESLTNNLRNALRTLRPVELLPPQLSAQLHDADAVRIRHGEYAFSELVALVHAISRVLPRRKDLVSIDADEAVNRVRLTIASASAEQEILQLMASAGLPTQAITFELGPVPVAVSSIRGTFRPTGGGLQVDNSSEALCSLGYNVRNYLGQYGLLVASHCAPGTIGAGSTGATLYQPLVGYPVAIVSINPPFNYSSPDCRGYTSCTQADALFATYTNSANWKSQVAHTTVLGQNNSGGGITFDNFWYNVWPPVTPYVGMSVDKVGRSTGWTRGIVAGTCENPLIDSTQTDQYVVLCAVRVTGSRTGQGDSGAPFFQSGVHFTNDPLYPLGILFAGGPLSAVDNTDPQHPFALLRGSLHGHQHMYDLFFSLGANKHAPGRNLLAVTASGRRRRQITRPT